MTTRTMALWRRRIRWLQTNIAPLIANSAFQSSGLLIITFDEGDRPICNHGGGQVATVIISSAAKKGSKSKTLYQHQSVLRLMLSVPGSAAFPAWLPRLPI